MAAGAAVTGLGELAEVFDLRCHRCGKPGPDMVEDAAALERLLAPGALTGQAAIRAPFGIRTVHQADIDAVRPVHKRCPGQNGQNGMTLPADRREAGKAPYDLLRSVG
jgi:hypothetical protein